MTGLILAAGQGRRMRPVTQYLPKPLLYLPGAPLLEYQILRLEEIGIRDIYIVVHHLGDRISEFVRSRRFKAKITIITQGPPFTILGAIYSAKDHLKGRFLVVHSDNYISSPGLRDYVNQIGGDEYSMLLCYPRERRIDAIIDLDSSGYITSIKDDISPTVTTGYYTLAQDVFPLIKKEGLLEDSDTQAGVFTRLVQKGEKVRAVFFSGYRKNINTPKDLFEVTGKLIKDWKETCPFYERGRVRDHSYISSSAEVKASIVTYSSIGEGARVFRSRVSESIVFPGATLKCKAIRRQIVLSDTASFAF